jgi:hypothetical protein
MHVYGGYMFNPPLDHESKKEEGAMEAKVDLDFVEIALGLPGFGGGMFLCLCP